MILPLVGEQKPYSSLNAPYASSSGQVSPDGHWIAFVSVREETKFGSAHFPKSGVGGKFPRQVGEHPAGSATDGPFTMRVLTEC